MWTRSKSFNSKSNVVAPIKIKTTIAGLCPERFTLYRSLWVALPAGAEPVEAAALKMSQMIIIHTHAADSDFQGLAGDVHYQHCQKVEHQ